MGHWAYTMPGYWKVVIQERNSATQHWTTLHRHWFDEFDNAVVFAQIFNKKEKQ